MMRRRAITLFALAVLAAGVGALRPALAQQADSKAEAIEGLPGVMLKLVPPADLCRVDPVNDADAFKAMARRLSGKVLAIWLSCPDLARYRQGADVEPARWMMLIAQRDGQGEVRPLPGVSRAEAFARWDQTWKTEAAQRMADAQKKLRADNIDVEIGQPQIAGPDGTAIYLIMPGQFRDAGVAEPVPVASVSGWSMFFDYRVGVSLSARRAGPDRVEPLRAEVQTIMRSLDRFSTRAPAP